MNSASPEGSLGATAATVTSSTQDETTAEVRVDNTEEASTEVRQSLFKTIQFSQLLFFRLPSQIKALFYQRRQRIYSTKGTTKLIQRRRKSKVLTL